MKPFKEEEEKKEIIEDNYSEDNYSEDDLESEKKSEPDHISDCYE
jgi:hypothetical protein